ncbi:MAG: 2-C-methyl-D-erythritol 4-phosphate cytidylyltransferase, partial [Verrucomicrobia bacterium RIFCSPLOWO2_12_FULL_64_8]
LFVRGGRERGDSVANALAALPDDIGLVFIHDCARPLIDVARIRALQRAARRDGAAVLAHRVPDTIKQAPRAKSPLRRIRVSTLDRSRLWAMETPQVFERHLISRAYALVRRRRLTVTDDARAIELLGRPVTFVENPRPNPKLTTPADLAYMEFLVARGPSRLKLKA